MLSAHSAIVMDGMTLYSVAQSLPQTPANGYVDKESVRGALDEYAKMNNFTLATKFSTPNVLHLKCSRGGAYRDRHKVKDDERKRMRQTTLTDCPYLIRLSKQQNAGFQLLQPKDIKEPYHNHPLTPENIMASSKGRKAMMTVDDIKEITSMIDKYLNTRSIQEALNAKGSLHNKLTVHDINNIRYGVKKSEVVPVHDSATLLIRILEEKNYKVSYDADDSGYLRRVLLASNTMIERGCRFSEVMVIDATYNTSNTRMPLVTVQGVSNLGGMTLRHFPVLYVWVSEEKEESYVWLLEFLKAVIFDNKLTSTIFVTDKCRALMNAMDRVFSTNAKLLCIWHMMNNVDKAFSGKFVDGKNKIRCTKLVMRMIESNTEDVFQECLGRFRSLATDESLYIEGKPGINEYFDAEWLTCIEKWAGYHTSQLKHFGCTSSQRAERSHSALKRHLHSIQPLDLAFQNLHKYIMQSERDFMDLQVKESSSVDILVIRNKQVQNLLCHVSSRALVTVHEEPLCEVDSNSSCNCEAWRWYGIPCRHRLPKHRVLGIQDIPERWHLDPAKAEQPVSRIPVIETREPWMECIMKLGRAFRQCEGHQQLQELMSGVDQLVDNIKEEEKLAGV